MAAADSKPLSKEALEAEDVCRRRWDEAYAAGLSEEEANVFAVNGVDVGQLRKLVAAGVSPTLIASIVL